MVKSWASVEENYFTNLIPLYLPKLVILKFLLTSSKGHKPYFKIPGKKSCFAFYLSFTPSSGCYSFSERLNMSLLFH